MRMRNPKYKDDVLNNCTFFYHKATGFSNDNPVHLEIGIGKGDFILNMALANPNINFIGVEKYSSVAAVAIKKIMNYKIDNIRILVMDAINLEDVLDPIVSTIYLNFSDPWPKKRHIKRRLTSPEYLKVYDKIFNGPCHIVMKTDNDDLFAYSLESLSEYGFHFNVVEYDLHQTEIPNIETEYEKKFSKEGIKIKYFDATK